MRVSVVVKGTDDKGTPHPHRRGTETGKVVLEAVRLDVDERSVRRRPSPEATPLAVVDGCKKNKQKNCTDGTHTERWGTGGRGSTVPREVTLLQKALGLI